MRTRSSAYYAALGRLGGASTSKAKRAASRRNGQKSQGRPRTRPLCVTCAGPEAWHIRAPEPFKCGRCGKLATHR